MVRILGEYLMLLASVAVEAVHIFTNLFLNVQ